jgi:hypothetical protein
MPSYAHSTLRSATEAAVGPDYARSLLTGTTYGINSAYATLGRWIELEASSELALTETRQTLRSLEVADSGPDYSRTLLTGSTYGVSALSAELATFIFQTGWGESPATLELSAASAGLATITAKLGIARQLAAAPAGTSVVSAALRVQQSQRLAAVATGTCVVSAALRVERGLIGVAAGTSTAAGGLYILPGLKGRSAGVSLVMGSLLIPIRRRIFSDGGAAQPARMFGTAPSGTPRMFDDAPTAGTRRFFKQ